MTIKEIKERICDIRMEIEELSDDCFHTFANADNPHTKSVADYLQNELTAIAYQLSDLEETEEQETDIDGEAEKIEDAEAIADWWCDLDLQDKCRFSNVPYPTTNYGRGDEYYEAEERCDKWWDSRTYEQKKEIYEENLEWWDKE